MISSEKQKQVTKDQIKMLKESLNSPDNPNISPKLAKAAREGVKSLIKDLEKELEEYELGKRK